MVRRYDALPPGRLPSGSLPSCRPAPGRVPVPAGCAHGILYELRGKGVNPNDSDVGVQFLYDMLYVFFTFDVGLQVLTSGAIFLKHLA